MKKQKRKVISLRNLPETAPLTQTAVLCLVLDRFGAPGWAWGVALTLAALYWLVVLTLWATEERVDVFAQKDAPPAAAAPFLPLYDFGGSRPTNPIYDSPKVGPT